VAIALAAAGKSKEAFERWNDIFPGRIRAYRSAVSRQ
jgi:hypothetical protein